MKSVLLEPLRFEEEVVISLYVDTTSSRARYEGYGIISSDNVEAAVDDVVNDSIEIQGVGALYYREG